VVGVVETVGWKLHYFCEDFQDYKLQRAVWRQVGIGWFTQQLILLNNFYNLYDLMPNIFCEKKFVLEYNSLSLLLCHFWRQYVEFNTSGKIYIDKLAEQFLWCV